MACCPAARRRRVRAGDPGGRRPVTLWFDTTDVWAWSAPQLTGIQRVVVHVLGEVLRSRADVKLFRFDPASRTLVSLPPTALAPAVQRHAGLVGATGPVGRNDDTPAAPAGRLERLRPLGLLRSRAPAHVRRAIDDYRGSRAVLGRSLRDWLAGAVAAVAGRGPRERRPAPTTSPPFGRGDVCLSLSLTWGFDGYWDAIAAGTRAGVPVIQLLHDITFVVHPQWVLPDWAVMGAEWLRDATTRADLLLVTSRFQREEIERYVAAAGLRLPPIEMVRLGDDPPALSSADGRTSGAGARVAGPFVLCVSGFYPRKNHHALYHVWRRLARDLGDRCPVLVLVGEAPRMPFELLSEIQRDPLTRDRVRILLDVGDDELAHLFRDCLFTVYPSHYEGWGLPVAESLRLGRYCVASSAASIPEVGGDLIDYVDPVDYLGLCARIAHAVTHPEYVHEREIAIRQRYRGWSWAETTRQILACVDGAAARRADRTSR